MMINTSWCKAMDKRKSRRSYNNTKIEETKVHIIQSLIEKINNESKLNIQFIVDKENAIGGFKASYGMISGVNSFIALVGNANIERLKEKIGYYGEMLVLECTNLELGTCWVGGTYDKKLVSSNIDIKEDEELICIITVGNVDDSLTVKEKLIKSLNRKTKNYDQILVNLDSTIPHWVKDGIKGVTNAPSALNKKPVEYVLKDNNIYPRISKDNYGYENVDLGISLLHFELGCLCRGNRVKLDVIDDKYIFYKTDTQ